MLVGRLMAIVALSSVVSPTVTDEAEAALKEAIEESKAIFTQTKA